MNGAIWNELNFFGISVLWGMLILILYDFLRIERRLISHNEFFIAVEDLIYWVVASLLIFHMMYKLNDGIIRGFSILAMLLGMLIYHYSISYYFVKLTTGFFIKIEKVIAAFINFLLMPFKFLFKGIKKVITIVINFIKKLTKILRKLLKKLRKTSRITVNDTDQKIHNKDVV